MNDLISRQAAIDALVKIDFQIYEGGNAVGRRDYMTKEEARTIIERLPSAQPTQSNAVQRVESVGSVGDCISRQAAIDALHEKDPSQIWDTADVEVWVNSLPSAQPLVLTCDGCRHVGTYDTDFPCSVCIRREKDYYEQER